MTKAEDIPFPQAILSRYRLMVLVAAAFLLSCIALGCMAKVDVVVTGDGSVSPDFTDYTLSAPRSGELSVKSAVDGDRLAPGDLILEFNCASEESKRAALVNQLAVTQGVLARGLTLASAVFDEDLVRALHAHFGAFADADETFARESATIFLERHLTLAKVAERSVSKFDARLSALEVEKEKTAVDSALARQSLELTRALTEKGYAPASKLAEERAAARTTTLSAQISSLEIARTAAEKEELELAAHMEALSEREAIYLGIEKAVETIAHIEEKIADAESALRGCRVRASVPGEIFWLTSAAPGSWIAAGQTLAKVVPSTDEIVIETRILEKDIAFVQAGQPVIIKLNSLPFTRYGALEGRVKFVSPDTVEDNIGRGTYRLYVSVEESAAQIAERGLVLVPGMAAQVDIVTGKRRIMDYFIDPILRAVNTSFRER